VRSHLGRACPGAFSPADFALFVGEANPLVEFWRKPTAEAGDVNAQWTTPSVTPEALDDALLRCVLAAPVTPTSPSCPSCARACARVHARACARPCLRAQKQKPLRSACGACQVELPAGNADAKPPRGSALTITDLDAAMRVRTYGPAPPDGPVPTGLPCKHELAGSGVLGSTLTRRCACACTARRRSTAQCRSRELADAGVLVSPRGYSGVLWGTRE
jgi:hypothetical protein